MHVVTCTYISFSMVTCAKGNKDSLSKEKKYKATKNCVQEFHP